MTFALAPLVFAAALSTPGQDCAGKVLSYANFDEVTVTNASGATIGVIKKKRAEHSLKLKVLRCQGANYVVDWNGQEGLVSRFDVIAERSETDPCPSLSPRPAESSTAGGLAAGGTACTRPSKAGQ